MIIWTLFTFAMVLGVKYYTSLEMRKLERRLETVKLGLNQVKEKLAVTQRRQDETEAEEASYKERLRVTNEIIQDLNIRLSSSDALDDERMVVSSGVPTSAF